MPRPAAVTRPALSLAAVTLAMFGIARTTGSGWLIVVLTGIGTVVGLAAVLPAFALRRVSVGVEAPRDATVGRLADFPVELGGGNHPLKLRLLGFEADWSGAIAPCTGTLAAAPTRRGVAKSITLEVRSAAPIGLVWWSRRVTVELTRPLEVGPRPAIVAAPTPTTGDELGHEAGRLSSVLADAVRTIREYVAGDPIKLVNWAATARTGELMVKELESPDAPSLVIAVDLRGGADDAVEAAASEAAGLAIAALRAGIPVSLLTAEKTGPRAGPVSAPVEVGRRLARAVAGGLPPAPPGTTPIVVRATDPRR
jgi:uncharacterized protein (DUF58 family)